MKNTKQRMTMSLILLFLLLTVFIEIPYVSDMGIRVIGMLIIALLNRIQLRRMEKEILPQCEEIDEVQGVKIYTIPYKMLGTHNAMLFQGTQAHLLIEQDIIKKLNRNEIMAMVYHELGHTHTISSGRIFCLSAVGSWLCMEEMHLLLYHEPHYFVLLLAMGCVILAEYMKRYVEYKADEYAVDAGCKGTDLLSAISKIEEMNQLSKGIVISGHPNVNLRKKRLEKIYHEMP